QIYELAVGSDEEVALDSHTDSFLGNVDSRLNGEDHARLEHHGIVTGIVDIFSMGIDVVVGYSIERIRILAVAIVDGGFAGDKGVDGRLLRAEHDVVDLPLPGGVVPIHRDSASNV